MNLLAAILETCVNNYSRCDKIFEIFLKEVGELDDTR